MDIFFGNLNFKTSFDHLKGQWWGLYLTLQLFIIERFRPSLLDCRDIWGRLYFTAQVLESQDTSLFLEHLCCYIKETKDELLNMANTHLIAKLHVTMIASAAGADSRRVYSCVNLSLKRLEYTFWP